VLFKFCSRVRNENSKIGLLVTVYGYGRSLKQFGWVWIYFSIFRFNKSSNGPICASWGFFRIFAYCAAKVFTEWKFQKNAVLPLENKKNVCIYLIYFLIQLRAGHFLPGPWSLVPYHFQVPMQNYKRVLTVMIASLSFVIFWMISLHFYWKALVEFWN
jgi:hypothetical protein